MEEEPCGDDMDDSIAILVLRVVEAVSPNGGCNARFSRVLDICSVLPDGNSSSFMANGGGSSSVCGKGAFIVTVNSCLSPIVPLAVVVVFVVARFPT